jgi:predicted phosphohydrolase
MDIFGTHWVNHVQRLEEAWRELVAPDDTVIIAGDTDWALHLEDAMETLARIDGWSGKKILLRGNHDYWWSSKTTNKVRRALPPSLALLHNNAFQADGFNICGAKGSPVPGGTDWTQQNAKLLNRETHRLELSLQAADPGLPIIVALHYPPFYPSQGTSPYRDEMERHQVAACVYGHLHGGAGGGPTGRYGKIEYRLVAGDAVAFRPVLIARQGAIV